MDVSFTFRDSVAVISLKGQLDTESCDPVWCSLYDILSRKPAAAVVDLQQCTYIASLGISLIIRLAQDLRRLGAPVRIANPGPALRTVLEAVNLGALVPIDRTIDDSLAKLTKTTGVAV